MWFKKFRLTPPLSTQLRIIRPSSPCLSRIENAKWRKKEKIERNDKVGSGWSSFRRNRIFSRSTAAVAYLEAIRDLISRAVSRVTSHVPPYRTNTRQTFRNETNRRYLPATTRWRWFFPITCPIVLFFSRSVRPIRPYCSPPRDSARYYHRNWTKSSLFNQTATANLFRFFFSYLIRNRHRCALPKYRSKVWKHRVFCRIWGILKKQRLKLSLSLSALCQSKEKY